MVVWRCFSKVGLKHLLDPEVHNSLVHPGVFLYGINTFDTVLDLKVLDFLGNPFARFALKNYNFR